MKINWGTGITIFIILFLGTVAWRIYLASLNPVDLVSEDYYPKSLVYKHQIEREKNARDANYFLTINFQEELIRVQFPKIPDGDTISGVCHFYRPSDNKLDKFVPIKLDSTFVQNFKIADFAKGKYTFKVYWAIDSTEYYFEDELIIP